MILEHLSPVQADHDLGLFATSAALAAQYPTGRPGDWARVTATATIWNWNGSVWVDSFISFDFASAEEYDKLKGWKRVKEGDTLRDMTWDGSTWNYNGSEQPA